MPTKGSSLCKGKSVKNPNRCKKVTGCKVARGTKRSYCRKSTIILPNVAHQQVLKT